jgi:hypothetical protein
MTTLVTGSPPGVAEAAITPGHNAKHNASGEDIARSSICTGADLCEGALLYECTVASSWVHPVSQAIRCRTLAQDCCTFHAQLDGFGNQV